MQIGSPTSRLGWKKLTAEEKTHVRQQNHDYMTCIWLIGRLVLEKLLKEKNSCKTKEPRDLYLVVKHRLARLLVD